MRFAERSERTKEEFRDDKGGLQYMMVSAVAADSPTNSHLIRTRVTAVKTKKWRWWCGGAGGGDLSHGVESDADD